MMIETEVCVVGAGPGGVSAAMFLAKMGISSVLVDKDVFPRDKICGDGISGWVLNIMNKLDPELNKKLALEPIQLNSWGARFVAPNFNQLDVPFKNEDAIQDGLPAGFVSKRMDFDYFLFKEARNNPLIKVLEGVSITEFKKENGFSLLQDNSGKVKIKSKLVIFANGALSRYSKLSGIKMEKRHYVAGIRTYYEGVSGMHEKNYIELHFLKELLPGYLWIFPLPNGKANVGLGMRSDKISKHKINLKEKLKEAIENVPYLKERFKNARIIEEAKGFGLPLGSKKRSLSGDHYMLVGDAASLIDPFTGEGIGNAMASGMYAAEHAKKCIEANDFSAAFMKKYDEYTYNKIWKELRLSKFMQDLLNFPWLFSWVVNKASANKTLRETISCMLTDLDVRNNLKKPSFYFKLLFD
ncbi:NAD(P)/FAD-dependent oxidoreductase [Flexithrix dorotheae]|uniref:NAD(P)/FAD-dependent oxidoreductase n=1 Tax=Flexithrix dorotheae TaxID=70993 RepID=UPI00035E111D|nr:NAD(P)/FAD-dependent oxidoreductase [Flexithrix dorotheae]